jgi:hypothetical protein
MATLELLGFEDLNDAFRRISEIPPAVTSQALDAMAGVAAEKIRQRGITMGVYDPESDVHILDKIKPAKAKISDRGGYEDITFSGTRTRGQTRTRNAEIAFVNEYGKRGQPARPFIGRAMAQNEEQISAAGENIVGDWIEKEFQK